MLRAEWELKQLYSIGLRLPCEYRAKPKDDPFETTLHKVQFNLLLIDLLDFTPYARTRDGISNKRLTFWRFSIQWNWNWTEMEITDISKGLIWIDSVRKYVWHVDWLMNCLDWNSRLKGIVLFLYGDFTYWMSVVGEFRLEIDL